MIKKIKSQTTKYINTWGQGAIIFNLGFNSELEIKSIMMIDYKSFESYVNKQNCIKTLKLQP